MMMLKVKAEYKFNQNYHGLGTQYTTGSTVRRKKVRPTTLDCNKEVFGFSRYGTGADRKVVPIIHGPCQASNSASSTVKVSLSRIHPPSLISQDLSPSPTSAQHPTLFLGRGIDDTTTETHQNC